MTTTISGQNVVTQTQLPSAVCNDLSSAFVDLGINLEYAGASNSNNMGYYDPASCCELCYNTPGCFMAYIAYEGPDQDGVEDE